MTVLYKDVATPLWYIGLSIVVDMKNRRIQSVDILRGVVIVLMAIDHVRVYSGVPPYGADVGVFFTRWITNFCAPAFVFFAGTSAFLYGLRVPHQSALARFLITRGLLLVVLEATVIRFFWTFSVDLTTPFLAGVIWMLGWCMLLLAGFILLKPPVVGLIGVGIVLAQQAFAYVPLALPETWRAAFGLFWEFIYPAGLQAPAGVQVLYVIVPWIGVMSAGYGFGHILQMPPAQRDRLCRIIGLSAIGIFLLIGSVWVLRATPGKQVPFLYALLGQQKYPASQLFLLMTLGPVIALVPFAERIKGWAADTLTVFGRVAMFFYLLHLLLIHLSAWVVNLMLYGQVHNEWYLTAPYVRMAPEEQWGLPLLYLVYVVDMIMLYYLCRAYARYKAEHTQLVWLRYL